MKIVKSLIGLILAAIIAVACGNSYANSAIVVKHKPLEPSQISDKHLDLLSGMKKSLTERLEAHQKHLQESSGLQVELAKCADEVCQMGKLKKGSNANTAYGNAMHKHAKDIRAIEKNADYIAQSMKQKGDEYYKGFTRKLDVLLEDFDDVAPLIQKIMDDPAVKSAEDLNSLSSDQRFQLAKYAIEFNKNVYDLDIMMKEIQTVDNTALMFTRSKQSTHAYANDSELYGDKLLGTAFKQQRQKDLVKLIGYATLAESDFQTMFTSINDVPEIMGSTLDIVVKAWQGSNETKSVDGSYKSNHGNGLEYIFEAQSMIEKFKNFKRGE